MQNKLLTIFLGLSFILFLLWNRLRTRLPRDFIDIVPTQVLMFLTTFILLVFLFVFLFTLKTLLRPPKATSRFSQFLNNSYILYWLRIKNYIVNIPYSFYEIVFNASSGIINLRHFVVATASPLTVYYNYPKVIFTLFFLLPKLTVSTIFVIDLCHKHQFTYFYNSLILLLIPLLTYSYLFMVGHLSNLNIIFIDKHLDIARGNGEVIVSVKDIQPTFEDAMDISKIDLPNLMNHRFIFKTIRDYASEILLLKNRKEPYLLLYTSLCYIIGWSYYLCFITDPSIDTFTFLFEIIDKEDPFSGDDL